MDALTPVTDRTALGELRVRAETLRKGAARSRDMASDCRHELTEHETRAHEADRIADEYEALIQLAAHSS